MREDRAALSISGLNAGFDGVSGIIHGFYGAAIGEECFCAALEGLGDALGGSVLGMTLLSEAGPRWLGKAGFDPACADLMMARYNDTHTNPMVAVMARLDPAVARSRQSVISDDTYFGSDLFNDIFRPQRLAHAAVACAFKSKHAFAPLGIFRTKGRDEFGEEEYKLLSLVLPHLERAIRTHLHIGTLLHERRHFERSLDALPFGVIFVDVRGTVWKANALAEAIARANDGLAIRKMRLRAAAPADNRALQKALSSALDSLETRGPSRALRVSRPSLRPPYSLLVVPMPISNAKEIRAGSIIFISDPGHRPLPSCRVLSRLFDLTPAQARLLALLIAGYSVEESALELGVSLETARTHVKALLRTTGTHRQSDLMRLVAASPAILQVEDGARD
jgi:DNA-binding CsgD family transcriptional regulator